MIWNVPLWMDLLGVCFALGMLHGVIPDEHTWPITFSYSVGAATGRGGVMSGLFFSTAFTIQRAVMSQLVYLAVAPFLVFGDWLNGPIYVVVGIAMAAAGYLILYRHLPHWHPLMWASRRDIAKHEHEVEHTGHVPLHWCIIHGFIAGFGVDAGLFTTFVYLVAVPTIPTAILGWTAGAAFGLGTLAVLVVIGLVFGGSLNVAKRWGAERVELFGERVGARSLFFGGVIFTVVGLLYPLDVSSYIPFDFGNFIVTVFMVAVIVPVMIYTWREVKTMPVSGTRNLLSQQ